MSVLRAYQAIQEITFAIIAVIAATASIISILEAFSCRIVPLCISYKTIIVLII